MIERLMESAGGVIGFKAVGQVTVEDWEHMEQQIQFLIHSRGKRPIGILVDFSEMTSFDLAARWEEMRFLQKHNLNIARMAVVGTQPREKISNMLVAAAALLQAETLYFQRSELHHAWHWVRTSKYACDLPPARISAADGVWKDYTPEYMDV
jgi:stage II sporulation SpoAA-like protein